MAEWLQKRGWHVIPSYDYAGSENNKAPRLQGEKVAFVIPDLDVSRSGRRFWVEVKSKSNASFTRSTQRLEHGISARHWADYWRVQRETGTVVWLFVVERESGSLIGQTLERLEPMARRYEGSSMGRGGMIFFPRDAFSVLDQFPDASGGH